MPRPSNHTNGISMVTPGAGCVVRRAVQHHVCAQEKDSIASGTSCWFFNQIDSCGLEASNRCECGACEGLFMLYIAISLVYVHLLKGLACGAVDKADGGLVGLEQTGADHQR